MSSIDKIAAALRQAYADHEGDDIISWKEADPIKRDAWRAIARRAVEMGASVPQ